MSDIAIRVEGLSKLYRLGEAEGGYRTLRESLTDTFMAPFRGLRRGPSLKREAEILWALKDISFDVKHGEVLGIIGRNGAGKSTLLKILSRITEPTEGHAEIRGRVGSLLEVGTGFHPELTGRENIFLNGAILGMKRAEILRKFDEIVAFAEVERFIDTAVKHYSSGMYVRLAFAVAAHLEPEILILDEVLAVGDVAFQQKCLGRLDKAAAAGSTVLLVSHNLTLVRKICERSLLLRSGVLVCDDETDETVARYQHESLMAGGSDGLPGVLYQSDNESPDHFHLLSVELRDCEGQPRSMISTWDHVGIRIRFHAPIHSSSVAVELRVRTTDLVPVLCCSTRPHSNVTLHVEPGINVVDCEFPRWPLAAGKYLISVALSIPMREWLTPPDDLAILETHPANVFHSMVISPMQHDCIVATPHTWVTGPGRNEAETDHALRADAYVAPD
jgi:lipopolysaccharide transport system ATP-binding protein